MIEVVLDLVQQDLIQVPHDLFALRVGECTEQHRLPEVRTHYASQGECRQDEPKRPSLVCITECFPIHILGDPVGRDDDSDRRPIIVAIGEAQYIPGVFAVLVDAHSESRNTGRCHALLAQEMIEAAFVQVQG